MADSKKRYVGPGGAVFVPNVDEDTIRVLVEAGEWKLFEAPKPRRRKADGDAESDD